MATANSMMSPGDMIYSMQMYFDFSFTAPYVLFEGFSVENGGQFFGALIFIFVLALCTEGLSFLMWKNKMSAENSGSATTFSKVIGSLYYFMLRFLNYCQMLVAMTFNFWLILAIAVFQFVAWYGFQDIKDGRIIKMSML